MGDLHAHFEGTHAAVSVSPRTAPRSFLVGGPSLGCSERVHLRSDFRQLEGVRDLIPQLVRDVHDLPNRRLSGGLKPPQYGSYNPPCEGCPSFGNGCQAIEIARACFGRFFQMRLEIVG
jgi:hypothetical protein